MTDQALVPAQPRKAELVTGGDVAPIIPRNVDELMRFARWVCEAGLAPPSYEVSRENQNPDPVKVALGIAKGAELGMPPMLALSTICIINKRPCLWGDGLVALLQRSGKLESWKEDWTGKDGADDWGCVVTLKRAGQDEPYVGRFTVKDARRANLWNNPKRQPWMQYPQRMLGKRALAFAARDGFADVLAGLSIAEEVQDIPKAPEVVNTAFLDDAGVIDNQPATTAPEATEIDRTAEPPAEAEIDDSTDWHLVADEIRTELDCAENVAAITDIIESKSFQDMKDHCAKETVIQILAHVNKRMDALRGRPHRDEAA